MVHRDYISVDRLRNDDFISINDRERDISGGFGKACLSRDLYRMATRFDFFRMLSIYYAGPGIFISNAILMTTVYLQTWVLVVLALAGAYLISSGTLREAEGIGLREDEAEQTTEEEPAPDEEQTENRRLLMDADRHLMQDGFYGDPTAATEVPEEEEPEEEPVDAAAALTAGVDDTIDDYYTSFYDPGGNAGSGNDEGNYEVPTAGGYSYSTEYVDPAVPTTAGGQGASGGSSSTAVVSADPVRITLHGSTSMPLSRCRRPSGGRAPKSLNNSLRSTMSLKPVSGIWTHLLVSHLLFSWV